MAHSEVRKKSSSRFYRKRTIQLTALALPSLILIIIFAYLPMAGIIIAFKDVNYALGIFKSPWVGFNNFKFFFTSSDSWEVIRNTIGYNAIYILLGTAVALVVALLMNEVSHRGLLKFYQTSFFFPYFFSWIVVAYIVYAFMSGYPAGILTNILNQLGISIQDFYINPSYWPFFIPLINIWKNVGYLSVIFYAALMSLPNDYAEAASIDGASRFQSMRYIMLPLIIPVVSIMVLLAVGKIFYSDFGLYYFVPRQIGQLTSVTQTIDTYVYRMLSTSTDIGMAAASGFFQSVMGMIVVLISNFVVRRVNTENSLF